jgi:hypothetical protein
MYGGMKRLEIQQLRRAGVSVERTAEASGLIVKPLSWRAMFTARLAGFHGI